MTPSVSVIIPTCNRAAFLREALESVQRQTCAPSEIIVVDDGSTDETRAVARAFGDSVTYLYQTRRGPGAARNAGIDRARGAMFAFLDDDDIWLADGIQRCLARLTNPDAPQVELVIGLFQRVRRAANAANETYWQPFGPPIGAMSFSGALIPRAVIQRVGRLDETVLYGEDIDWYMRARELGVRMAILEQVTTLYRRHANNLTNDYAETQAYLLKALSKSLTRRAQNNQVELSNLIEMPTPETLQNLGREAPLQ
ncbi:MAG: glycosyl transferase family A [Chloroflexota bacterium]|nr:MAG: glycosyl transferase family A [Chloroflexota bacterium]